MIEQVQNWDLRSQMMTEWVLYNQLASVQNPSTLGEKKVFSNTYLLKDLLLSKYFYSREYDSDP
jgi:hypothetical protein